MAAPSGAREQLSAEGLCFLNPPSGRMEQAYPDMTSMHMAVRCVCQHTKYWALCCSVLGVRCHEQARRAKPEPRACPLCAQRVGLSSQAVAVHLKAHHRLAGAWLALCLMRFL
jgi:hypothetical protein